MSPTPQEHLNLACHEGDVSVIDNRLVITRNTAEGVERVVSLPLHEIQGMSLRSPGPESDVESEPLELVMSFVRPDVVIDGIGVGRGLYVLTPRSPDVEPASVFVFAALNRRRTTFREWVQWPDLRPPTEGARPDLLAAAGRAVQGGKVVATGLLDVLRPDELVLELFFGKGTWVVLTTTRLIVVTPGVFGGFKEAPLEVIQGVLTPEPGVARSELVVFDGAREHRVGGSGNPHDVSRLAEALRMMLDLLSRDGQPLGPPRSTRDLCRDHETLMRDTELGSIPDEKAAELYEAIAISVMP